MPIFTVFFLTASQLHSKQSSQLFQTANRDTCNRQT